MLTMVLILAARDGPQFFTEEVSVHDFNSLRVLKALGMFAVATGLRNRTKLPDLVQFRLCLDAGQRARAKLEPLVARS